VDLDTPMAPAKNNLHYKPIYCHFSNCAADHSGLYFPCYRTFLQISPLSGNLIIIITRVCSLYGNRKLVIWSLYSYLALALIGAIVLQMVYTHQWTTILYYEFLPGCWIWNPGTTVLTEWPVWVVFLAVEGVLMLLTTYQVFSYRNSMNRTISVLARDSIVYFIIIFAFLILDLIVGRTSFKVNFLIPTRCISSIAVGRMMMNIRGLILEDPGHTLHLQTLQFDHDTVTDSDTHITH